MRILLEEKDVLESIVEEFLMQNYTDEKKMKEAQKRDQRCKSYIVQCLDDSQLDIIRDKTTAYSMWKSLEDRYEKKGIPGQLMLKKKLISMKLKNINDLEEFLTEFDEVIRQLKATGVEVKDEDIICNLLLAMPPSVETIITILENMDPKDLTINLVKTKLRAEIERRKATNDSKQEPSTSENIKSAAFTTEKLCHGCGKKGHLKEECWFGNRKHNEKWQHPNSRGLQNKNFRGVNRGNFRSQGKNRYPNTRGHYTGNSFHYNTNYAKNEENSNVNSSTSNKSDQNLHNDNENDSRVCFNGETNISESVTVIDNIRFCIDSGCTDHLVNNKNVFKEIVILDKPVKIAVAKNNNYLSAIGVGNILAYGIVNGKHLEYLIKNVFYVPELRRNLLSVKKLEQEGIKVTFENGKVKLINKNNCLVGLGKRENLYEINFNLNKNECFNVSLNNEFMKWHKRYAHLNYQSLEKLIKRNLVDGIEKNTQISKINFCEPCISGKMSKQPFGTRTRSKRLLEIVHTDVCGPISPTAHDGSRYFVTFIDDFSNFTITYLIKNKSDVFQKFQEYYQMTKSQFGFSVSKLICDNGGEYVSGQFKSFCRNNGVILDYTIPYTPEQNGKAERMNRTLVERARTMINDSGVPKELWGEAIYTATYIVNRGPTESLSLNVTPAEIWYGRKPNVSNFRVFGSTAYSLIQKENRDKFDVKVEKCVMVGYTTTGYRLWSVDRNKIFVARDVKFNENEFLYRKNLVDIEINQNSDEVDSQNEKVEQDIDGQDMRNKRQIKIPSKYDNYELYMAFEAINYVENVPSNFQELEHREDKDLWMNAMMREIDSINKNKTWELVDKPENKEILDTRWVYAYKSIEKEQRDKYKARLVVRGFAQKDVNYDELYSPVAKMTTIRTLLSIGNQFSFHFQQLDVKSAFLNSKIESDIYIYPPIGLEYDSGKVLKLNKSLYGLKQSSKCWNNEINNYLRQLGFIRSENDFCLYILKQDSYFIYLLIYVDDIILAGINLEKINEIITKLMTHFEIKNKGNLKYFLGLEIDYNREQGYLKICQSKYVQKLLSKFNMEHCKGISTPIDPKLKLDTQTNTNLTDKPFRQLIGCLMYLMLGSRPDICFVLNYFSRYQDKATDEMWSYLKRVIRYLKSTMYFGLKYTRSNNIELHCYVDSDWGNSSDRKSVSGYLFKLFGNTISWTTRKQNCVTLSTTESELVALCSSVCEGLWLRKLLKDFDIIIDKITFFEDNQGCIAILKNPENNKRVKHIDIKYNFVCENIEKKIIEIKYLETVLQEADILTKGLMFASFDKFRNCIGLKDFSEGGC